MLSILNIIFCVFSLPLPQVDTKANPPRAIWVHPYEDEQFLREHPEVAEKIRTRDSQSTPTDSPPPYSPRRHSYSGSSSTPSSPVNEKRNAASQVTSPVVGGASASGSGSGSGATSSSQSHRGFFGKLKDKAIGTKEEREEAKRQQAVSPFLSSPPHCMWKSGESLMDGACIAFGASRSEAQTRDI